MVLHSNILAQKIPRTEEPGRLQSMGPQRVGHDLATKQQQQPGKENTVTKVNQMKRQRSMYQKKEQDKTPEKNN